MKNKVKIFKAFTAYKGYLLSHYQRDPDLATKSYEEQRDALVFDAFPWIYSWANNNPFENIEIFETVHNCEWLQKSWSPNLDYGEGWQKLVLMDQIKNKQPNVCVLYPPEFFTNDFIEEIRHSVKHDIIIVGYDGINRENKYIFEGYDLIITCSDFISEKYVDIGKESYTLNFAFDRDILNRLKLKYRPIYKTGFSGSIFENIHQDRLELIKYIARNFPLEIRSEYPGIYRGVNHLKKIAREFLTDYDFNEFWINYKVWYQNKGPVYGLDMYQFLHDTKIVLNKHIDTVKYAANVRMYEATGVGSCLLTDWKENIETIFIPDEEIVTYSSKEEAKDKIKFLLKNESVRTRIARAGQKKTLSTYTYQKNIPQLLNFIKNLL